MSCLAGVIAAMSASNALLPGSRLADTAIFCFILLGCTVYGNALMFVRRCLSQAILLFVGSFLGRATKRPCLGDRFRWFRCSFEQELLQCAR